MIQGINIGLTGLKITYNSRNLLDNLEIQSLINDLQEFFKQKGIIYSADLILSNNKYRIVSSDFGEYKQRIDYTFRLFDLKELIFYDTYIILIVSDNNVDKRCRINISKDFFYFLEWEDSYYL